MSADFGVAVAVRTFIALLTCHLCWGPRRELVGLLRVNGL